MTNNNQTPFNVNQINNVNSKTDIEEKKNILKKYKGAKLDSDEDKKQVKNHKVRISNNNEIIEGSEKYNEEDQGENKKDIYIYTDNQKRKYFYTYHKISKNKDYYQLRCKDRKCNGRAKYDLEKKEIIITQDCTLNNYEEHNYLKSEIIRNKIKNNEATLEDMNDLEYQKYFFIETYLQYLL